MEFNKKLQDLRKNKNLTQEELAKALFVSRTAVSKWESGNGFPNIDSLRQISLFFGVSLDCLLSPSEALNIAQEDGKRKESRFCDLVFGLLDVSMVILFFLPLFAERIDEAVVGASLLALTGIKAYLKVLFIAAISTSVALGILTLALGGFELALWHRCKNIASLAVSAATSLLFTICLHPYAAVFSFTVLIIKFTAFIRTVTRKVSGM